MAKKNPQRKNSSHIVDPLTWAKDALSPEVFERLVNALKTELDVAIRINLLKTDPQKSIKQWGSNYQWKTNPVPFCPSGFWIKDGISSPGKTIEHRMGYYYIQEAASMLPVELFDFSGLKHPLILDMAASPGGKTIHLIDRSGDKGLVVANDASRSRTTALCIVLQNWGAVNQAITCMPGEWYGSAYPETFDAVLIDAPCSMQGLRASPSHKMRPISENEIASLAERQQRLLESALLTARIGGQVVYSTCTLSPKENEGVVSRVLDRFSGLVEIEDIQFRLPTPAHAMTNFHNYTYHQNISHAARLWPHAFGTAGFFCAKLVKKGKIQPTIPQKVGLSKQSKNGLFLEDKEAAKLTCLISDTYGFDLQGIIETQALTFRENKKQIYLYPVQLQAQLPSLPSLSNGLLAGKLSLNGWQPSHEFVSRFGDQFTRNTYVLRNEFLNAWIRGEDIRELSGISNTVGKIYQIRDVKGRNLGRGKILKDRLKNMLPTRLF